VADPTRRKKEHTRMKVGKAKTTHLRRRKFERAALRAAVKERK